MAVRHKRYNVFVAYSQHHPARHFQMYDVELEKLMKDHPRLDIQYTEDYNMTAADDVARIVTTRPLPGRTEVLADR